MLKQIPKLAIMAFLCHCFHIRDPEELQSTNNNRNCICPSCIIRTIFLKYKAIFSNGHRLRAPGSTAQVADAVDAESTNVQPDGTVTVPPRTRPFGDEIMTCSAEQHAEEIKEHENNHASEGTELLLSEAERSAVCSSESQIRLSSAQLVNSEGEANAALASESSEHDECPICLEEYIPENPRIDLRCSHNFHLSCLYEWIERSEKCPICAEIMIFDEVA